MKKKRIICKHDFNIEQCDFCGHTCEMCMKCEKGRCSAPMVKGKRNVLTNPYI